jgi:NAD/NADP octopine/nopaline dehydrogenase, alpha-helical domain
MQITICGGGNAAHTLAGLLSSRPDLSVSIYAPYDHEAERWQAGLQRNGGILVCTPERNILGKPQAVYSDARLAVQGSQLVLLALPAFAHELILEQIAGHIAPGAWVGALPARGGFDICIRNVLKERLDEMTIFGFQTLPWACRIQEYGQRVSILGTKAQVDLAVWPSKQAPELTARLHEYLGIPLNAIASFLSLTLADTGQLIHPGIMYGLFHDWDGQAYSQPRPFYQGVDEQAAETLEQMSQEVQALRAALERAAPGLDLSAARPLVEWLRRSYPESIEDNSTLQSSFVTNRSYAGLLAPMYGEGAGFMPDFHSRYLSEDVPYGLLVTRGIAELAGVETPVVDQVISWAQSRLGRKYLVDSKLGGPDLSLTRSPQRFGYTQLDRFISDMQYLPLYEEAGNDWRG